MKAKLKNIAKNIQPAVGLTAGAVAAGFISNLIPEPSDPNGIVAKVKPAAPLILGLVLMSMGKKGMIQDVGAGMVAAGGKSLVNSFGIGFAPDPISYIDVDGDNGVGPDAINGMEDTYPEDEMPV